MEIAEIKTLKIFFGHVIELVFLAAKTRAPTPKGVLGSWAPPIF